VRNLWHTLTRKFGWKKRNSATVLLAKSEAYNRVLNIGGASHEDCQTVLADLLARTGYYEICPTGTAPAEFEAGRKVGHYILSLIELSDSDLEQLRMAAREEAMMEQQANNQKEDIYA